MQDPERSSQENSHVNYKYQASSSTAITSLTGPGARPSSAGGFKYDSGRKGAEEGEDIRSKLQRYKQEREDFEKVRQQFKTKSADIERKNSQTREN